MHTRSQAALLAIFLLPLGVALDGCGGDDPGDEFLHAPSELRGGDLATLRGELELLRDGLSAAALDPDLVALAHERVLVAAKTGEYEITLADLADAAADLGLDLAASVQSGVLAQGGSDADAAHAVAILDAFAAEGVIVAPTLYIPHLDLGYFDAPSWEAPGLLSTVRSDEGDEVVAREPQGPELLVSEATLAATPTWLVSYRVIDGEDPHPLRFWARCYCVQTNPDPISGTVGVTCQTAGSATILGTCGRTGFFNDSCNGVCMAAGGV